MSHTHNRNRRSARPNIGAARAAPCSTSTGFQYRESLTSSMVMFFDAWREEKPRIQKRGLLLPRSRPFRSTMVVCTPCPGIVAALT